MRLKKIIASTMALSMLTAGIAADAGIVKNIIPAQTITADAASNTITSGDWRITVTGTNPKTCKISKYLGSDKTVSIPYAVSSYAVTAIGEYAFSGDKNVKVVNIPRGVRSIDRYAFFSASALEQIRTSDTVRTIGDYAFYNCDKLTKIDLCYGNDSIGSYAFSNCDALRFVTLPYTMDRIGEGSFSYCSNLSEVTIKNAEITFGRFAFKNCYVLDNFNMDNYYVLHSLFSTGALANTSSTMHINNISLWSYKAGQPYLITTTRDYVNAHKYELLRDNVSFYIAYKKAGGN